MRFHRWILAGVGVTLVGACAEDGSERTALLPIIADAGNGSTIDCRGAAPQSLCVPDDGEVLLYGAVPFPDVVDMQLFRSRPERADTVQLTPNGRSNPTDFNSYGARSPDRQTLAFISGRDKSESPGSVSRGLLYLAAADGTNVRRLTLAAAEDCDESMPRFSPDGEWLSFWRECASDQVGESGEFMFRIRPDGSDEQRLVDVARAGADSALLWGTFARDGRTLYALEDAVVGTADGGSNILVAYDFGSAVVTPIIDFLPEGAYVWGHPLELASGELAYLYRNDDAVPSVARLESIRPDGTGRTVLREIPVVAGLVREIRFMVNPAGDRFAYVQNESSTTTTLWVSDIDGSDALQVAPLVGSQFWLTWNP